MAKQTTSATSPKQPKTVKLGDINMNEMAITPGVDPAIAGPDFLKIEAFMHEELKIMVHPSSVEGAYPVILPNVSGMNQPIICGQPLMVKRKYVEVLARTRATTYTQDLEHKKTNNELIPHSAMSYPFDVIEDPSGQDGREWLLGILNEKI